MIHWFDAEKTEFGTCFLLSVAYEFVQFVFRTEIWQAKAFMWHFRGWLPTAQHWVNVASKPVGRGHGDVRWECWPASSNQSYLLTPVTRASSSSSQSLAGRGAPYIVIEKYGGILPSLGIEQKAVYNYINSTECDNRMRLRYAEMPKF